jgi:serine/threonine protein kinase
VKRTEIAVQGAPANGALRLELIGSPSEDGLLLEFLHDERQTGTLARVCGGQIGLGEVSVPVAVKLQRDSALSQEDRGSVAAKFDKERNVHRRLQDSGRTGDGHERIVRQLEVWTGEAGEEADSFEPSILCARARHALTPRCPECNDPEALLEELQLTDDYGLRCSRCHRQFWSTPKTREAILGATLRRDPACHGCEMEHSPQLNGCQNTATFLSFFRNRVLLLERLDLDLDDYLRWKSDQGPIGPRRAARQGFEAHRRLVQERRARLQGPSVAKIADLLTSADLFSEILSGAEYLHQRGVAHLDLKPANVCVRFRGSDLEVKIIDLGLSDDPNTLAYLRQAEGPLSLWTDYSAPEFRKPRSRPVQVDGRFREEACELVWPRPQTPAQDVPCPGDTLLFEDRELAKQRFRVVAVRPGAQGRLSVQAKLEPRHILWLGEAVPLPAFGPESRLGAGLAVVLEKYCGFPADVYSLGMLLLAVLVGHPDVGDFRESLPGVQIELEESLRERPPLPSRAAVQLLLREPSKHLHVFQSYVHRLDVFGAARPLAEELLGLVLRATLRGDPKFFYLADRGSDARIALRRFRSDLDAVMQALRNALTAAQAVGVQEARFVVLDQLRGRLQGRPVEPDPVPRLNSEGRLLYPALDLGTAGDEYRSSELAYLPSSTAPVAILERWERELSGLAGDRSASGRGWDFLQRYCRRIELDVTPATQFLERFRRLNEQLIVARHNGDSGLAADGDQTLLWVDEHQALAERLANGPAFVVQLKGFLAILKDRLLIPWDRALRAKRLLLFRRNSAPVTLSQAERDAVREQEIALALDQLEGAAQRGRMMRQQRGRDFAAALQRWRSWCASRSWLDGVLQLEADAIKQWELVDACCRSWEEGWDNALGGLRDGLTQISVILHSYAPLLAGEGAAEEVTIRQRRSQREALDLQAIESAVAWLQENWPAPSERVEALYALWELGGGVVG